MARRKPRYKFLYERQGEPTSSHGNLKWRLGEWVGVDGEIDPCYNGLHCSVRMFDAFSYVSGEIVARAEVRGKHESTDDKEAWSDMRLVDIRRWRKEDSVALSIYASELCISNYEAVFPNDDRPRKAIEAAKKWLAKPTEANRKKAALAESAARSARSAAGSAAWSARSAAGSAAWSAESAAWSAARSAAGSAARSAESAAESAAGSAAWSAESAAESVRKKINDQINDWMEARFDELPVFETKEKQ